MLKLGDVVKLKRQRYRGRFKNCKHRVGRINKIVRLKYPELAHKTLTFYSVEGFYEGFWHHQRDWETGTTTRHYVYTGGLKLLGEDLELAKEEDWIVQESADKITSQ